MGAVTYASLFMTLLSVVLSVSAEKEPIRAEPGQTVSLPCKALNNDPVIVLKWRRTDPKPEEGLLLYRNDQIDPEYQHQSYQNRVDLQDRQMKDGNVSLSLNNVNTNDSGTYECSVVQTNSKRAAPVESISIIRLDVVPSGHTDGRTDGHLGLIVVAGVAVLLIVVILFFTVRHMKKKSSPPSSSSSPPHPPSADQPLV